MSHGPPAAREFRRDLRRDATDAERAIWWIVRNRHLGAKFRRQHPMGPFVLDFYCATLKLAIELDGGQHFEESGLRYDQSRDAALRAEGVRTLRFTNLEVLQETEGVAAAIWEEVGRLTAEKLDGSRGCPLTPPLPRRGGGEGHSVGGMSS